MIARRTVLIGLGGAAFAASRAGAAQRPPLVLAAASLQESLNAAADAWARLGHVRPVLSFAASSALARQVAAGAAADLFISADEPWMDDVERRGLIVPGSRATLVGNRLVVVQPARARPAGTAPLSRLLTRGRVALADPASVPAGRYAQASLTRLGLWAMVAPRIVRAENVRAALALVERGAAEWGLVYATDARASQRVRAVRMLPAASHPPIRYPIARLRGSASPDAEGFRRFLLSGAGRAIFARFGFTAG
ncbi:molybdate ABC transporter substrate-binding protein [Sphingomonas psychrotolerans]|uniref:Molybdate ABC transporter substrate-binding protein n=1 Tax=Sphingomonas psychrotolerans TaxID=1327635 RepID=A0ABU3MY46_9SPHN|nr:molybdate ABC transporter substrate-binding protein [Sphingomonas psychrotolerans]MDT8757143.1 molybdate ABC transporter substrate-binding protein [Sphingomonas psychrotolerans]